MGQRPCQSNQWHPSLCWSFRSMGWGVNYTTGRSQPGAGQHVEMWKYVGKEPTPPLGFVGPILKTEREQKPKASKESSQVHSMVQFTDFTGCFPFEAMFGVHACRDTIHGAARFKPPAIWWCPCSYVPSQNGIGILNGFISLLGKSNRRVNR